ncbi:hypothetical protein KUTeg_009851 [Tegillarca granosa]|uniref:Intraflagellar transport protein 22 homolog n=1 Tax=Tegillarca granosa TaxID=220873 RepID=A0ABQ9FA22_TEGGR|nr:hypothetical protein KUTeg_010660 [Tegillarca granosa]KAJ8312478.1 hypothetical protein KUTeg_009851 [Tegillarca granosa]
MITLTTVMFKVKLLMLGPCESGKTVLANFLADATDTSSGEYHPTQGVRFEGCWPAIAKDTIGIVFVYNPDQPNHDKDLDSWFDYFVEQQAVKKAHCIVFAHHKPGVGENERTQLSTFFKDIPCIQTNIEEDGDSVRNQFSDYLSGIMSALTDNKEQEELSIMNHR